MSAASLNPPTEVDTRITRADIERGQPSSARQCPIAVSLNREHGGLGRWEVSGRIAFLFLAGDWVARYALGEDGEEFAHRFDHHHSVSPANLRIEYLGTHYFPPSLIGMGRRRDGGTRGHGG